MDTLMHAMATFKRRTINKVKMKKITVKTAMTYVHAFNTSSFSDAGSTQEDALSSVESKPVESTMPEIWSSPIKPEYKAK